MLEKILNKKAKLAEEIEELQAEKAKIDVQIEEKAKTIAIYDDLIEGESDPCEASDSTEESVNESESQDACVASRISYAPMDD